MRLKVGLLSAIAAGALVLCASAPAKAIMMTVSVVNNSTLSLTGGGSGDRAASQSVAVGDTGGSVADVIGNTIDAASRYISTGGADRGVATGGGTATAKVNSDYTLTVNIVAPFSGEQWSVKIDHRLTGGLTARDDASGLGNGGGSNVSSVTGQLNGGGVGALGLATAANQGGTSNTSGVQVAVNSTGTHTVNGTGSGSFTLRFVWNTTATSPQALNNGDEHGTRFGVNNPHASNNTDDYPGTPSRDINNDGHFVGLTLTVNVVPEPSTLAMAGIGAVGLVLAGWRRRRAR